MTGRDREEITVSVRLGVFTVVDPAGRPRTYETIEALREALSASNTVPPPLDVRPSIGARDLRTAPRAAAPTPSWSLPPSSFETLRILHLAISGERAALPSRAPAPLTLARVSYMPPSGSSVRPPAPFVFGGSLAASAAEVPPIMPMQIVMLDAPEDETEKATEREAALDEPVSAPPVPALPVTPLADDVETSRTAAVERELPPLPGDIGEQAPLALHPRRRWSSAVVLAALVALGFVSTRALMASDREPDPRASADPPLLPATVSGPAAPAPETHVSAAADPPLATPSVDRPSAPAPETHVSAAAATVATPAGTVTATARPAALAVAVERGSDRDLPVSELLHRANAAVRARDPAAARARFQAVIARDPTNAEAHLGLGMLARARGDDSAARVSFAKALLRSPSFIPARLALADLKWDRGERDSARQDYAAILDRLGASAPEHVRARARGGA